MRQNNIDTEKVSEKAFRDLKYYQSTLEYPEDIYITNNDYKIFKKDPVLIEFSKSISGYEFSELDAITQYIKHNVVSKILSDEFPEISNDLLGIGMIEMKHFDELCNFFLNFDLNLMANSKNCLEIKTSANVKENLEIALEGEFKTIEQYKNIQNMFDDSNYSIEFSNYFNDFLNKLIKDEETHVRILRKHISKLKNYIENLTH